MTRRVRQLLIVAFTFIGGFYFFMEFILPAEIAGYKFGKYHDEISRGIQVIGIMAVGLGIINILRVHGGRLLRSRSGWINSLALILGLFTMLIVEGINLYQSEQRLQPRAVLDNLVQFVDVVKTDWQQEKVEAVSRISALRGHLQALKAQAQNHEGYLNADAGDESAKRLYAAFSGAVDDSLNRTSLLLTAYENADTDQTVGIDQASAAAVSSLKAAAAAASELTSHNYEHTTSKKIAHFFFHGFFVPLGAAMFSLLAFYIATAAYRSFRVRSLEALVMMVPAIIVMLGQIPHGPIYVSDQLPEIRRWLLEYLNTPAFRAIFFGAATAGLAMAVRMWLSLETSPLSSQETEGGDS